jgi:hypothetical protein
VRKSGRTSNQGCTPHDTGHGNEARDEGSPQASVAEQSAKSEVDSQIKGEKEMVDDTRQNVFNRRNIKRKEIDSSWGKRLTEVRSHKDANGNLASRFGDSVYAKPTKVAVAPETPKVLKTRSGTRETESVTSARLAEEARREALKNPKPQYTEPSSLDVAAIAQSFVNRHSNPRANDFFYPSLWNNEQLIRAMEHYTRSGQVKWDSAGFDAVHKFLMSQGYYEPVRRLRGMLAPKEFPKSDSPVIPNSTLTPNEPDERARLKSMDINELAKLARAGYSKNLRDKVAL